MKAILLGILLVSSVANAHFRLKASNEIKIRSTNPGVKSAPCGNLTKVAPAVLAPGQTITVSFEETIYHPGRFEIYFSQAGETNFQLLKTIPHDPGTAVPHPYTTTVTLPNVTCDNCVLQMIQVMAENPNNPTYYYSCADMQLKAGMTPTPTPNPTPTPTTPPVVTPTVSPTVVPSTPVDCH